MNIYIQGRKRIKDVKISEVEDVKKKCDPERSCMRNTVHSHDRVWFKSKVTSAPKYGQLPLKAKNLLTRLLIRTLLSQLHSYINVYVDIVKTTIYRSTIMFDFREEREEKEREREREISIVFWKSSSNRSRIMACTKYTAEKGNTQHRSRKLFI